MLTSGIRRGLKYQSSKSLSTQDLFHPQEETHCISNDYLFDCPEIAENVQHKMNSECSLNETKLFCSLRASY